MAQGDQPDDQKVVDLKAKRDEMRKALETGNIALAADEKNDILKELNEQHAYIKSFGGKPMILQYTYNHVYKRKVIEFIDPNSFILNYADRIVLEGKKEIELGKWWLKHTNRRIYETVIFDPEQPKEHKGCLNMWEGMTIKPKAGDWRCICKHIYDILSNRDASKFRYVMKWLAWMLQNPGKRAETVLIFKGKEGAGKGFIFSALIEAYGEHGYHASSKENFVGRFTSHLGRSVFLFADEANLAGDREAEGVLKQLITEAKIPLEAKYRDVGLANNYLHIVMSTNQEWVVPAHDDSRRYFINEVDNRYAKNQTSDSERKKYFDKLLSRMYNGGLEAMLHDLINMDLKGWHPRDAMPLTVEMQRQVVNTLPRFQKALLAFINDGTFPGTRLEKVDLYKVSTRTLTDYLEGLEPQARAVNSMRKADLFKRLGAEKKHGREGNFWIFPPLRDIKLNWERNFGRFNWDTADEEEWRLVTGTF